MCSSWAVAMPRFAPRSRAARGRVRSGRRSAPKFYRGGNTRHTRNMRCAHDAATETLTGPYTEEEFFEDLLRVTGGHTDEELARLMIAESRKCSAGSPSRACASSRSLGGTLSLGRTNSFFLGGGRAMLNALYLTAERLGVEIYTTPKSSSSISRTARFRSATVAARRRREHRVTRRNAGRCGRWLRGQHRMAEGILGRRRPRTS